ncbi:MAG: MBL fold metallo-hydrolase [Thermoprotei archaeon]|nr:MAG: MBL fold metallo-hydrolase [Thermoprotei archaeon]
MKKACLAAILSALVAACYAYISWRRRAPPQPVSHAKLSLEPVSRAKLIVVVDNNPYGGLKAAWGLSIYVEAGRAKFLFDAGPDPQVLEENMRALGISAEALDFIVISHEHGDHVGGLPAIAEANPGLTVYVPKGMSPSTREWIKSLGFKVVEVEKPTTICEGVAVTGPLYGPPYEQALITYVKGVGLIVVTGCSHPGIEKILAYVHNITGLPIYAVIGGFHLVGAGEARLANVANALRGAGVGEVYPIHCSGEGARKYLSEALGPAYRDGHVGTMLEYGSP